MKLKHEVQDTPPDMFYVWGEQGGLEELEGKKHLISAGVAWENPNKDRFNAWTPEDSWTIVDSGGFQAATQWKNHRYPYTAEELFEWAEKINADVVAGMDVACERAEKLKELPNCDIEPLPIQERLKMSLENQIRQEKVFENGDWDIYHFMPVVQGNTVEQYEWFALKLKEAGILDKYGKIGIGSTCKRDDKEKILEILEAVNDIIRDTTKIHLFGATIEVWKDPRFWDKFQSSDSAAWKKYHGYAEDKEEKRQFLKDYIQRVEEIQNHIEKPGGNEPLTEFEQRPTVKLLYAARRGDLDALDRLKEIGWDPMEM